MAGVEDLCVRHELAPFSIKRMPSPLPTPGILCPEGSAEASEVPVPKAAQCADCVGIRGSAQIEHTAKSFPAHICPAPALC